MRMLINVLKNDFDDESKKIKVRYLYDYVKEDSSALLKPVSFKEYKKYRDECIAKLTPREKRIFEIADNEHMFDDNPIGLNMRDMIALLEANGFDFDNSLFYLIGNFFNYGFYLGKIAGKKGF